MATKWKNTIKEKAKILRGNKRAVIGMISMILAIAAYLYMYMIYYRFSTTPVWMIGGVINFFSAMGLFFLLQFVLKRRYIDWKPENYDDWKRTWKRQQKILAIVAMAALFFAITLFSRTRWDYYNAYYVTNYAFAYMTIAMVILHYGVCQACIISLMNEKMRKYIDSMAEISQERLDAAIEIEMQSIEKATQSERMKVDLISNVSHDLKTPLTSMVGYIELMKKEELSDTMQDYVDVLSNKSEKLKEMIESLFSLAKASSGNIQLNMEVIQMNKLVEQIFADMAGQIEKSDLSFVPILTGEDTHFTTDNAHMYRIGQNLVENAIKYSAKNTRVYVKTYVKATDEGRQLYLEIANTAGYMMNFDKESIVERFSRGDAARSSDGNGLGLAIVSTYTGALGGTFDLSIDYDQFKVTLSFPQ